MASYTPRREELIVAFGPVVPLLHDVIEIARAEANVPGAAAWIPSIGRKAGYSRMCGFGRWLSLCEQLVRRSGEMPVGFGLESSDAEHQMSRYAWRWPKGLFMIRQDPHDEEEEGKWFGDRLEGLDVDQLELAPGLDASSAVKAFVSIPANGMARVYFTHCSLERPIVAMFDELANELSPNFPSSQQRPQTEVRSIRRRGEEDAERKNGNS